LEGEKRKYIVMLMGVGESEVEDKGKKVVDLVLRVLGVEKGDVEYIGRVGRTGSNLSHRRPICIKVANSEVRRMLYLQATRLREDAEVGMCMLHQTIVTIMIYTQAIGGP